MIKKNIMYLYKYTIKSKQTIIFKNYYVRILFFVSLLFIAVINPYSVLKFLIFKYSS